MDAATVADAVARGNGIAARVLGNWCVLHRPTEAIRPMRASSALMRLPVRFVAAGRRASSLPHPVHEAVLDGAYVRVGDVLVGDDGLVWIVASCEVFLPVLCVRAARIVGVSRGGTERSVGLGGYGGAVGSTPLLDGWPASMVASGGGLDQAGIPTDVAPGAWSVLLPLLPAATVLRAGDVLGDDLGRSGVVTVAEPTPNGWHLTVRQAVP